MKHRLPVAVLAAGAGILALAALASADQAVVAAAKDNTLFEDAEGDVSDGSGPVFFVGANSKLLIHRGVIAFDVASAVPSGARVDSVSLTLTVSNSSPGASEATLSIHRLTADWGEGSSSASGGAGAAAAAGDATWLHTFYPDSFWQNPGGDFASTASGSGTLGLEGTYSYSGSGLAADVQGWLDGSIANDGWILIGDESTASSARRFESRESATTASRPSLTVYYTPGESGSRSSWGEVKARYPRN